MKKVLLSIVVLFTAASIALACGENCKKSCCNKGEKTCAKKDEKACAGKDEKSCAKAKSCCKSKMKAEGPAPANEPSLTPAAK